jgi:carbonic anhydrase
MAYPMVRKRVELGVLKLHGWHYVIEDGEIHVFDVQAGAFVPASVADHSGTGPYQRFTDEQASLRGGSPKVIEDHIAR